MTDADVKELFLIGFRIEPDIFDPQIYTIYINDDRPILFQNRPILFASPGLSQSALEKSDCGAVRFGPAPTEVFAVFDITQAMQSLAEMECESRGEIVDLVNAMLDFGACIKAPVPRAYAEILPLLADHLTFQSNIASFFEGREATREDAANAMYWFMGMIMYYSYYVSD